MTNKENLEELIHPHTRYWDCWSDCPLEYDHTGKVVKIVSEFTISFCTFFAENCFELFDSKTYYIRNHEHYDDAYSIKDIFYLWENGLL